MTYTFEQLMQMDLYDKAIAISNMTEQERKAIVLPTTRRPTTRPPKEAMKRVSSKRSDK